MTAKIEEFSLKGDTIAKMANIPIMGAKFQV
jgi:hypothetical protein